MSTVAAKPTRTDTVLYNLEVLDGLLKHAFARAEKIFDRQAGGESRPWEYRGLYVSREDTERLLGQPPGAPLGTPTQEQAHAFTAFARKPIWGETGGRLGLTPFDQAVTMLALAPELDLRYERLYAYLHDDITRRRPTVNLALDILCPDARSKLEWRAQFGSASRLIGAGLLELVPDPNRVGGSWLDRTLHLDEQTIDYLAGESGLDARLALFCEVGDPDAGSSVDRTDVDALASLAIEARNASRPLVLCFHGPRGTQQRQVAHAIAVAAGVPLMAADLGTAIAGSNDATAAIASLFRGATLRDAVLFLDDADTLLTDSQAPRLGAFNRALARHGGVSIISATRPWTGASGGVLNIPFAFPDFADRRTAWQQQLRRDGLPEDPALVDRLASSFVLSHDQIAAASAESVLRFRWLAAEPADPARPARDWQEEVLTSARAQAGHDLAALARKVDPVYRWEDLVVPTEVETQLREIASRTSMRHRVLEEWGFDKTLAQVKGVSVLFTGPSGAGKTMAAEVLANELRLDLYKIDLSGVVSKYIGETEKNLERIFSAAERSNAILCFDEADALFGKRSEVRDAHDRYANIEVSYLLQRMEDYQGIAILSTNLRGNLDDAFVRRIAYTVRFPLPGEAERLRIWQQIWPAPDMLAPGLDLAGIARTFRLSGGNIRSVALAASFFAAGRGERVTRDDLLLAIQREYDKVGKTASLAELRDAMVREPGDA